MADLIIYRTCDRPLYTERSFPHIVEHSSKEVLLLFMENSSHKDNILKNVEVFSQFADKQRMQIKVFNKRIGINKAIKTGIELFPQLWRGTQLDHILIADDDVLVPETDMYWDRLLCDMLDNEPWDFVGFYGQKVPEVGLNQLVRFMSGACSAFKYEYYKLHPLDSFGIFGYNLWTARGRCGRYAKTQLWYKNMDKDFSLNMSLRDTVYKQYSAEIDAQRHKGRKK